MKWLVVCAFLTCAVSGTCGRLHWPCNVSADCDAGECCTLWPKAGFMGICRALPKLGEECQPRQSPGDCGCPQGLSCVANEPGGVKKCLYLPE